MQTPRLPQELVDEVFGYLYDDEETLKPTSLLSRACNTSTIPLLFRSIHVDISRPLRNYNKFILFLKAAPSIQLAIVHLHLTKTANCNIVGPTPFLDADRLITLLEHLPNLRVLLADSLAYNAKGTWPEVTGRYTLKTLSLTCIPPSQHAYRGLLEMLSIFSRLEHLYLANIPTIPAQFQVDEPHPPIAGLIVEALSLERMWHPILPLCRDLLRKRPRSLHPHSLHLPYRGVDSVHELTVVFPDYGSRLTRLGFDVLSPPNRDGDVHWHPSLLRDLTILEELSFIVHLELPSHDRAAFDIIREFLFSLPTASLRYITIYLASRQHKPHDRIGWQWDGVDNACKRFPFLTRVELLWTADEFPQRVGANGDTAEHDLLWDEPAKETIRLLLPWLESQTLLRFDHERRCHTT